MPRPRRRNQSGFAMLLVVLMASVIAISLYLELPRVAFDAQRQKEQLLIDRGEQYKRGIKVFYTTNKRFPTTLEELDTFNNRHYLRKRYRDPISGKDEWRLVHIQNGVLTDSKVVQPQTAQQQASSTAGQYVGEQAGLGQTPVGATTGAANLAQRRRASDDRPAGLGDAGMPTPGGTDASGLQAGQLPGQPGQLPGQDPGQQPGQQPGQPGMGQVGQLPPGTTIPGVPGMPGQGLPGFPGSGRGQILTVPGQNAPTNSGGANSTSGPGYVTDRGPSVGGAVPVPAGGISAGGMLPGNPVNSQTGGVAPVYGTAPGSNGTPPAFGQPGMNSPNGAAQTIINNILTTPRAGPAPSGTSSTTTVIGGGIAGVASVADQEGIKVYGDRTNYSEWEFVYDINKDIPPANPVAGTVGTTVNQINSQQNSQQTGTKSTGR